jgi:hypothetical protein
MVQNTAGFINELNGTATQTATRDSYNCTLRLSILTTLRYMLTSIDTCINSAFIIKRAPGACINGQERGKRNYHTKPHPWRRRSPRAIGLSGPHSSPKPNA